MRSEITTDPEIFKQCTDTIIRQVGDIGRMVDEFSSFARMPAPVMRRENAAGTAAAGGVPAARRQSRRSPSRPTAPKEPVYFEGDGRLIAQALTNVLKNAGEGIAARIAKGDDAPGTHRHRARSRTAPSSPIASPTMASACRRNTATG